MAALLKLVCARTRRDLTIVDGSTDTGYARLLPPQWGAPQHQTQFSGAVGTQGARSVGGTLANRALVLPVRISGATLDEMLRREQALALMVDEMRRYGGEIVWRPTGASFRQRFQVVDARLGEPVWAKRSEVTGILDVSIEATTRPYAHGDPMYSDNLLVEPGEWTVNAGTEGTHFKFGPDGEFQVLGSTTIRLTHTEYGYRWQDGMAQASFHPGATGNAIHVAMCVDPDDAGNDTYLAARLDSNSIDLIKVEDGSVTQLATTATGFGAYEEHWFTVRIYRTGARLVGQVWNQQVPGLVTAPDHEVLHTLSASDRNAFYDGTVGFQLVSPTGTVYVRDFGFCAYGTPRQSGATARPYQVPCTVPLRHIPGDAPALCDWRVDIDDAVPAFALLGWSRLPLPHNAIWNGGGDAWAGFDTVGWSAAAGLFNAAATSISRITSDRSPFGGAGHFLRATVTTSADSGVFFRVPPTLAQPDDHEIAIAWVKADTLTTNVDIAVGASGETDASPAVALTTGWQLLSAMVSTPITLQAEREFTVRSKGTTAGTIDFTGANVFYGKAAALAASLSASALTATLERVPPEWGEPPYFVLIDVDTTTPEVCHVTAATDTQLTFGARGLMFTTDAAHSTGDSIVRLPPLRHLMGQGALPPVGIVPAITSIDTGGSPTLTSTSAALWGDWMEIQNTTTAADLLSFDWLVDPSLIPPDEFTDGELAVEVWAKINYDNAFNGTLIAKAALAPETSSLDAAGNLVIEAGEAIYTDEHGTTGKTLLEMTDTVGDPRMTRVGTLRFPRDSGMDTTGQHRWRLWFALEWTGLTGTGKVGLDYLLLVPAANRAASPTGKPLDSTYPVFMPGTAGDEIARIVHSDLSSGLEFLNTGGSGSPAFRAAGQGASGLGGTPIEIGPGDALMVPWLGKLVPDDPTVENVSEIAPPWTSGMQFRIVPRYWTARGE